MLINFGHLSTEFFKKIKAEAKEADIPISQADIAIILKVEWPIFTFLANYEYHFKEANRENIWSILTNYRGAFPPPKSEQQLNVLRFYFAHQFTLPSWRQLVENYLSLPSELRIYHLSELGYFYQTNATIYDERTSEYSLWLDPNHIRMTEPDRPAFIEQDDRNYYFLVSAQGAKEEVFPFTQSNEKRFPKHLIETPLELQTKREGWMLPSGRDKVNRKKLSLNLGSKAWMKTAEEMNAYITKNLNYYSENDKKHIRDWIKAHASFDLKSTGKTKRNHLVYKEKVGIAGLVGAGKTTFLTMEVFRLKQLGAKTGIIMVNVVDTLMLVYRLHLLGIKAVPLIGRTGTKKHLKDFLRKVKNETNRAFEVNPLSQLAVEYVLQFFEGECLASVLSKTELSGSPPCLSLHIVEGNPPKPNKYACPLFTKCGKYTNDRLLREADVWVGTLSAFQHSKPMPLINPFDYTYAEQAHFELDVLFVDEADSVQESADLSFITDNKLFGEPDAVFEGNFLEVSHKFDTRYDYSRAKPVHLWRFHSTEANRVIHLLFELIDESRFVRSKINNRTFGIHKIMAEITKAFYKVETGVPVSEHLFFYILKNIDLAKLRHSEKHKHAELEKAIFNFVSRMIEFKQYDNYEYLQLKKEERGETKKLFKLFQNRLTTSVEEVKQTKDQENDSLLLFRFFIYHLYFDFHFKSLMGLKNTIEAISQQTIEDISAPYYRLKRYLPFLPEAATGRTFQYYYKETNRPGAVGTFQNYNYLAIGRYFLTDLGSMYEHITGTYGPAMCFMSGTSFAEGSLHFHVDVPLEYILSSTTEKRSRIDQFLYPVYSSGKPIFISGEPNEKVKQKKLKTMVRELVPKIKEELMFWKHAGRKVLLVVNSYEQAAQVQQELERFFPNKVYALTRKMDGNGSDHSFILRSEVEFFAEYDDPDILVVPLLSINRGYNVLKKGGNTSLFGSIFFLIRPYIPGDSIGNMLQVINGSVPSYIKKAKQQGYEFYEVVKYVRKRANTFLEHMLLEEPEWTYLDTVERSAMAWYMFVNVWQMIGRLLRGQTDARVFYVDAPFAYEHAKGTGKKETLQSSMLRTWLSILEKESSNEEAKEELYGEFIRGLREVLRIGGERFDKNEGQD
jgi:hypothetical protein